MHSHLLTIRHSRLTLLAIALLAGCATLADVEKAKGTWHGATYDDVVARWGVPTRESSLPDGSQVYSWASEGVVGGGFYAGSSVGVFGGSGRGGVGISLPLPGMGGGGAPERCDRNLTFKDGRVVDQIWLGSPNYCSIFGR